MQEGDARGSPKVRCRDEGLAEVGYEKLCLWVLRYAGSAEVSVVCAARLAGRLSEVQVVDESLQDGCDDRGPSGRSEGEHGVSVARNDREANTAPRALAAFGGVGEPRCRMFFVYSSDP